MKELLFDLVHCTKLEFLLKHPLASFLLPVVIFLIVFVVAFIGNLLYLLYSDVQGN